MQSRSMSVVLQLRIIEKKTARHLSGCLHIKAGCPPGWSDGNLDRSYFEAVGADADLSNSTFLPTRVDSRAGQF